MQALYGYDVAADLQPGCRYDEVARALGGAGETSSPDDLAPPSSRPGPGGPTWSTSPDTATPTPDPPPGLRGDPQRLSHAKQLGVRPGRPSSQELDRAESRGRRAAEGAQEADVLIVEPIRKRPLHRPWPKRRQARGGALADRPRPAQPATSSSAGGVGAARSDGPAPHERRGRRGRTGKALPPRRLRCGRGTAARQRRVTEPEVRTVRDVLLGRRDPVATGDSADRASRGRAARATRASTGSAGHAHGGGAAGDHQAGETPGTAGDTRTIGSGARPPRQTGPAPARARRRSDRSPRGEDGGGAAASPWTGWPSATPAWSWRGRATGEVGTHLVTDQRSRRRARSASKPPADSALRASAPRGSRFSFDRAEQRRGTDESARQ